MSACVDERRAWSPAAPGSVHRRACGARRARRRRPRQPFRTGPHGRPRRRAPSSSRRGLRRRAGGRATASISVGAHARRQARGGLKASGSGVTNDATRWNCAASDADGSKAPAAPTNPGLRGARVLEDEAEQHEAEVAVDRLRPRRVLERQRADRVLELGAAGVVAEQGQVGGQPGAVRQQIDESSRARGRAAPFGQPSARPDRSAQPAGVDGAHGERGRGDNLGQRGEIEDGVGGRGGA